MFSTPSVFLTVTSNGFSQVGHNVHNVTPRVHIIVEKAQFIEDIYAFNTVELS